ncbi:hypothetical protein [Mycobacteroides abscessus]|uniref:hypothetical protein n=1 Tax=Mycobacteroides abscessus TaxID=36809 RepID=UPI0009281A5A|nr:hypothetical protein [Mycobacteroides abscessus]SHR34581.1 Bacteriophage protein [Mycobacteroides abscessus subsp. abscessus]SHR80858.1 Bacteriophage protein [Mycobacteroides abscessus subsp. abscessus]SHS09306.1 Bacteriophage protein [Mycobacteroides abscessus subsp. abscessus]SHS44992.1 Bacteriophage protein [Mycobacteroides abscessus subsp. abscessus]SHS63182.1 Bacteriophage protein [Mycobacteroides abscessus subsp. abscessus]
MTDNLPEIPDWARDVPSAPVHREQGGGLTRPFTAQQLQEFGKGFIEQFLGRVVLAVMGHLIPGVGSFDQLREWAKDKPGLGDLVELLTGIEDGDENDLGTWALGIRNALAGIDLAHPESILTAIAKVAGQFLKGVIPASWVADVAHDLLGGAGGFTDPSVVEDNPDWHFDATQNGHLSGKSIYVNADGQLYAISIKDSFEVAPGQIVDMAASAMWQGITAATGSNPIRLCITPFGPDRTKLPEVIVKQIQPVAADSSWVRTSLTGSWTVPSDGSVKWATVTLIVTAGATSGRVHFSNVTSAMSNLGPVLGKFRSFFDTIGGQANSDIAQFEQRFAAITADGKITASEILGLLGLGNIPTLPQVKIQDLQTTFNQLGDIYNGLVVTPINGFVSAIADWFQGNKNKTQGLNSSGQLAGSAITGAVANGAVPGLQQITDAINAGAQQAVGQAIDTVEDAIGLIFGLGRDALKAAIAAQTTLQEQETEQNTGGGNSYSFTFSGADGAALNGADWTTGPNPGDVTIRGDSGYAGVKNGNSDGYFFASPNYTYATDGQSASFVLGDTQNGNYYSGVYIRCDSGRTQGAYCLAREGEIRIGKFTRSGSSWSFSTPLTLQTGLSAVKQGARIEIRCSGTNYFVRVNGRQVLSATDAGNTINIGAAYRYSMFSVQRASPFFTYDSYRIAAFAMSDYTSAGAGFSMSNSWSIRRDSTADVTYGPYSSGAFPSGFFTFNDYTTDVTLDDLGTARIEIATTGLYRINTTYRSVTAKGTSVPYWVVYKNGTRITGAIPSGCPFEIPLVAGDVVQPGFIAVDYDLRSNGSTGSETVVSRSITALSGIATFDGRRIA